MYWVTLLTFGEETQDRIGLVKSWVFVAGLFVVSGQKGPVEVHHVERIPAGVSALTRLTSAARPRCSHPIPQRFVESGKGHSGIHQRDNCAQDPADKPPHVKSSLRSTTQRNSLSLRSCSFTVPWKVSVMSAARPS